MITLCMVGETWFWYDLGRNSMNLYGEISWWCLMVKT